MVNFRTAVLILCLTTCVSASAQQMYKTVGADGRVTFSDRPKIESAAKLSVMKSYTLRPVNTGTDAGPVTAEATPASTPTVVAANEVVVGPQVETAMVNVMVQSEFARRSYPFCNGTQASARAFTRAAGSWKQRNLLAVEHQRKLLMQVVSPVKRTELQDKVAAVLNEELAKVTARSPQERIQWCGEAVAHMASERSDVNQPEMMAVVIKPYKK